MWRLLNVPQIVELLNIIYCIAQLVEFAAFVTLRFREPDLHRWVTFKPYMGNLQAVHVLLCCLAQSRPFAGLCPALLVVRFQENELPCTGRAASCQ